jgi:ABC-type antimicrobial peptide transport system permease subunit
MLSTIWFFDLGQNAYDDDGEHLRDLSVQLSTDSSVASVQDWSSAHRDVEKNGGLIYGTPGLLSLQFVVSALAAVASSFVFLSLVLSQRRKELSILQAIGGSPSQVMRLVLFEILSITIVSMALGGLLGMGISYSFNGLFNLFGQIFQVFGLQDPGGSASLINRDLVWPFAELLQVGGILLLAVLVALVVTTRKAIGADLATVLKGE